MGKKNKWKTITLSGGKLKKIFAVTSFVLIALLTFTVGYLSTMFPTSTTKDIIKTQRSIIERQINLNEKMKKAIDNIDLITNSFKKMRELPTEAKIAAEIYKMKTDITLIIEQTEKINEIIIKNPEEALSWVLLKKDIENFRSNFDANILALEKRMQLIQTLLMGTLIALGIGLVSAFIKPRA